MHNLKKISKTDRYGNSFSLELFPPEESGVPEMSMMVAAIPDPEVFKPKGTDTVPAMLTPGENVVNAEASRIPGNQEIIDQMNDDGRAIQDMQGGPIPSMDAMGGDTPMYASGGGYSIPNPMISEKMILKAYDDYLKDFNIELPNPNMALNYEDFKESVLQHNAIKFNKGGQVPVYASTGINLADFLKEREGVKNEAYLDVAGNPTIGVGSTTNVKMGDKISDEEIDNRLASDIQVVNQDYDKLVTNQGLNQNQETAVKSLIYNIGGTNFGKSKALQALNQGDYPTFLKEAKEFRMAGGKVIPGLVNRREIEFGPDGLFNQPIPTYVDATPSDGSGFSLISSAQASPPNLQKVKAEDDNESFLRTIIDAPGDFFSYIGDAFTDMKTKAIKDDLKSNVRYGYPALEYANKNIEYYSKQFENNRTPRNKELLDDAIAKRNDIQKDITRRENTVKDREFNKEKVKKELEKVDVKKLVNSTDVNKKEIQSNVKLISEILNQNKDNTKKKPTEKEIKDTTGNAQKYADENPTIFQEVKTEMSKFFPMREVVRAGLAYLGSRLLGYGHAESFDYVGKDYLKRVDKSIDAKEKFGRSETARKQFKSKSIAKFLDTLDYDDLEPIGTGGIKKVLATEMYDTKFGEKITGYEMGDGSIRYRIKVKGDDGKTKFTLASLPEILHRVRPYRDEVDNPNKIIDRFNTISENLRSQLNNLIDDTDKQIPPGQDQRVARAANAAYAKLAKRYPNIRTAENQKVVEQAMERAMTQYYKDYKAWLGEGRDPNTEPKVEAIDSYFFAQTVNLQTGGALGVEEFEGMPPENQVDMAQKLLKYADTMKGDSAINFNSMIEMFKGAWGKYTNAVLTGQEQDPKLRVFANLKVTGYNPFMNWVKMIIEGNPNVDQNIKYAAQILQKYSEE